jgi:hypothetical protein
MSLAVAIPLGIGAAVAYGAATAGQHSAAHTGSEDTRGLLRLVRDPRWLVSMLGDVVGLVLHVLALLEGPVVLIQPLLVLALPVSLPIAWWMGGPRPTRRDYLASAGIVAALAVFFAIIGNPGPADLPHSLPVLVACAVTLALSGTACVAVRGRSPRIRAGVYGAVAGACFGLVGVLMDAATQVWQDQGIRGFIHEPGLVTIIGLVVVGIFSNILTQISYQVGPLGTSFPANLAADPIVAVALGAVLLYENVPVTPLALVGYAACVGGIVACAIPLANAPAIVSKSTNATPSVAPS